VRLKGKYANRILILPLMCFWIFSVAQKKETSASSVLSGKILYAQHCLTCHQADGAGAQNMVPTLSKTDFVLGNKSRLINILLNGLNGEITVNSVVYGNEMPSQAILKDGEIAALLTYIRNNFGNKAGSVTIQEVKKVRASIKKQILIVYLSRTNNTRAIAEMIQRNVGGTLVPLELVTPYPANYHATVQQVVKENETGYLPPLKTKIDSIGKYDIVFVGFPTWDMKMPPPMKSFLKQYDLSGKTVIPFNTNAGYGVGSGFQSVKELCPNSKVMEGFSIEGGIERDGVLFVMKGEKAKEAETEVKKWVQKVMTK
jgi:flavodoxin/mono/diheme cytochrome c family protein